MEEVLKAIQGKRKDMDRLEEEAPSEHYYREGYCDALDYVESIVSRVELPVKPACEIGRPQFRDYLPADTTTQTITNIFLGNKELHSYIVALDEYIDELESKSV